MDGQIVDWQPKKTTNLGFRNARRVMIILWLSIVSTTLSGKDFFPQNQYTYLRRCLERGHNFTTKKFRCHKGDFQETTLKNKKWI